MGIVLLTSKFDNKSVIACFGKPPKVIHHKEQFHVEEVTPSTVIIGFNTGIIVPAEALERAALAVNFHAAPPSYPGRDPHHWAIYEGATEYGCTLHKMVRRVDEGEIYAVDLFDIPHPIHPFNLYGMALIRMLRLLRKTLPQILANDLAPCGVKWTGRKRTRKQFHEICAIPPDISAEELARRRWAFEMPGRKNIIGAIDTEDHVVGSPDD